MPLLMEEVFLTAQNTLCGDSFSSPQSPHSLQPSQPSLQPHSTQTTGIQLWLLLPVCPRGWRPQEHRVRGSAESSTSPFPFILLPQSIKQTGFSCCCFAKLSFPAHDSRKFITRQQRATMNYRGRLWEGLTPITFGGINGSRLLNMIILVSACLSLGCLSPEHKCHVH